MTTKDIINRVANSGLIDLDLSDYFPKERIVEVDLKQFLFQEKILKEREFRKSVQNHDFSFCSQLHVAIYCSSKAIVPMWSYMLIASRILPIAKSIAFGTSIEVLQNLCLKNIDNINADIFRNKRVIVKGCGDGELSESMYVSICAKLQPVVKSLMYGEACSSVPVYKKSTQKT